MARVNSRETLIDYCLRKLGAPVLEINVDPDQVEDRIDDALQKFKDYHSDGSSRVYLKHQITQQDITNGYITLNDAILYVVRVLPLNSENSSINMFDARYQMYLNDMYGLNFMGNMAQYFQTQQYISLIDMTMDGSAEIVEFNRHLNQLHLQIDWANDVKIGQFIVVECYRLVDPDTYTDVYNDGFLKKYATALIKQQWGANLIKFEGMQLPGGITLNGRQIFEDAMNEIDKIEEEMQLKYELPPMFIVG